jgi:hypothetical protein
MPRYLCEELGKGRNGEQRENGEKELPVIIASM